MAAAVNLFHELINEQLDSVEGPPLLEELQQAKRARLESRWHEAARAMDLQQRQKQDAVRYTLTLLNLPRLHALGTWTLLLRVPHIWQSILHRAVRTWNLDIFATSSIWQSLLQCLGMDLRKCRRILCNEVGVVGR